MNNELEIFKNDEFGEIRTIEVDDKIYFVASDVAKSLAYKNTSKAIKDHCRWVTKRYIPHPQNKNKKLEVNTIPEGDIYRLVANSELPNAEKFESWIFDEVLPTIRKTGGYINNADLMVNTYFSDIPDEQKGIVKGLLTNIEEKQKKIVSLIDFLNEFKNTNILFYIFILLWSTTCFFS